MDFDIDEYLKQREEEFRRDAEWIAEYKKLIFTKVIKKLQEIKEIFPYNK